MNHIFALVTARSGSKGVPGKNLRPLAGKPLIAWTIGAALSTPEITRVVVSTDGAEIAEVARHWGADVPFLRPAELSGDESGSVEVAEHALGYWEAAQGNLPSYLVLLQPTSPLRSSEDISRCIRLARERNAAAVVSVCEAHPNPYLARRIRADGSIESLLPATPTNVRRQDFPACYNLNGAVFVIRPESLLESRSFTPPGTLAYVMPQERSLDIDTLWDFQVAEAALGQGARNTS